MGRRETNKCKSDCDSQTVTSHLPLALQSPRSRQNSHKTPASRERNGKDVKEWKCQSRFVTYPGLRLRAQVVRARERAPVERAEPDDRGRAHHLAQRRESEPDPPVML